MTTKEKREIARLKAQIDELSADMPPGCEMDLLSLTAAYEATRAMIADRDAMQQKAADAKASSEQAREELRSEYEPHIKRGKEVIKAASLGGREAKKTADLRHDEWQKAAEKIWAKFPSYSRYKTASILHKHYEGEVYHGLEHGALGDSPNEKLMAERQTIFKCIKKPE